MNKFSCLWFSLIARLWPSVSKSLVAALLIFGLGFVDAARAQTPHNILLVIADDLGVDMVGAYKNLPAVGNRPASVPSTPAIDDLAAHGILFRNAWVDPICGATRASLQTGRYGFRTGMTSFDGLLPLSEFTIGKTLRLNPNNSYTLGLFGKWGLSLGTLGVANADQLQHPIQMGYDVFAGTPGALLIPITYTPYTHYRVSFLPNNIDSDSGAPIPNGTCAANKPGSYQHASCIGPTPPLTAATDLATDSISAPNVYATTQNANDAISLIDSQGANPWLITLAFNAPHQPLHLPPSYDQASGSSFYAACNNPSVIQSKSPNCYRAMVEAMDIELGRVIAKVKLSDPDLTHTTIIFIGDNGSVEGMAVAPFSGRKAKFTLYQGGVNVPLIIAGADVLGPTRVSDALVNGTDLFMTVLDIARFAHNQLPQAIPNDSRSIFPILQDTCAGGCQVPSQRKFAYAETSYGNSGSTVAGSAPIPTLGRTVRDLLGYKLIASYPNKWEFYNLAQDPFETKNLVVAATGVIDPSQFTSSTDQQAATQALTKLHQLLGDGPTPNIVAANLDTDGDGILDDGDGSGHAGDTPCIGGNLLVCDDNCPTTVNSLQEDPTSIGVGYACRNTPSLSLNKTRFMVGEAISAGFVDNDRYPVTTPYPTDWVGIYPATVTTDNNGCITNTNTQELYASYAWLYVNGSQLALQSTPPARGVLPLTAPSTPGSYVVGLFGQDAYCRLANFVNIDVVQPATVSLNKTSYAEGETITASYANGPGTSDARIAMFPEAVASFVCAPIAVQDWNGSIGYVLTGSNTSGQVSLTVPTRAPNTVVAGKYVVGLFDGNYCRLTADYAHMTVPSTMSIDNNSYAAGATIHVSFSGPGNYLDWIGIYPSSVATNSDGCITNTSQQGWYSTYSWAYGNGTQVAGAATSTPPLASGVVNLTAPTAGSYVVGFFGEDGFCRLANFAAFTTH